MGRRLVDELDTEPPVDTLGCWMAHYIAELIDAVANGPRHERVACQKRCFGAILELWSHRAVLPNGKRPFEDLEPIVRAIESLDPDDERPRFFRSLRGKVVEASENPPTQSLLEFVRNIDSVARFLIGHALADAAQTATDKSKEWVRLAGEAGIDPGFVDVVVHLVSSEGDSELQPDPSRSEREMLQNRISQLENFMEMASLVSKDLKARLETSPWLDE